MPKTFSSLSKHTIALLQMLFYKFTLGTTVAKSLEKKLGSDLTRCIIRTAKQFTICIIKNFNRNFTIGITDNQI